MEPQLYNNCQHLCHHWCSIYWFLIHFIINHWSSIWYRLMGRSYYPIVVSPELKNISFIKIYFRYIYQKLELMYHKKFLIHDDEIKDNISNMKSALHNMNHEKKHKYVFMLLINDLCSNIFCGVFFQSNWNWNVYLFLKLFTRDSVIPKRNVFFILWNDFLFTYLWQVHL